MPEKLLADMTDEEFYTWLLSDARGARRRRLDSVREDEDFFCGEIRQRRVPMRTPMALWLAAERPLR
jgi:hypothetical protein